MTENCWMNYREESLMRESRSPDLPQELIHDILSRLPPTNIYKFKCLCKSFCTSTDDDTFLSRWRKKAHRMSEPELPVLLCSIGDDVRNISSQTSTSDLRLLSLRISANKWRSFPGSVLLPSVQSSPLKVLSTAGGLVLTVQDLVEYETLCVINPLARTKREISSRLELGYRVRQLVMDDVIDGRYIIFAENIKAALEVDLKLLIYDSMTEQWMKDATLRTIIRCPLIFTGAACLHGTFYCLAITQETAHMFQFDRNEGWRDSDARVPSSLYPQKHQRSWMREPGRTVCKPHLFRNENYLMLAGVTMYKYGTKCRWDCINYNQRVHPGSADVSRNQGVHLWKLDEERMNWKHQSMMPRSMFSEKAKTYDFLSSEGYLFVNEVIPEKPRESSRRFYCKLSTGCWRELPPFEPWDPSSSSFKPSGVLTSICTENGLIVYEPRIDAKC